MIGLAHQAQGQGAVVVALFQGPGIGFPGLIGKHVLVTADTAAAAGLPIYDPEWGP